MEESGEQDLITISGTNQHRLIGYFPYYQVRGSPEQEPICHAESLAFTSHYNTALNVQPAASTQRNSSSCQNAINFRNSAKISFGFCIGDFAVTSNILLEASSELHRLRPPVILSYGGLFNNLTLFESALRMIGNLEQDNFTEDGEQVSAIVT